MDTRLRRIGRYELSKLLDRRKTHEVWLASDPQSRRSVTINMISTAMQEDSDSLLQLRAYIERVAALRHPGLVPIRDVFVLPLSNPDGLSTSMVCLVTDFIQGQFLADHLRYAREAGKIRPGADIVHLFTSLSLVIDYAHQQGIIHGSLNPSSIVLKGNGNGLNQIGEPVLTDFDYTSLLKNARRTASPFYLSPEQIRGYPPDERSDIYSLGVILYELCTGVLPFRGNRPIAIMMQHLNAQPTPPQVMNTNISSALSDVIVRGLTKEPEKRFSSAASLAVALARALNTPVPEALRQTAASEERSNDGLQLPFHNGATPFLDSTPSRKNEGSTQTYPAGNGTGIPLPSAAARRNRRTRSRNSWYLGSILVLLFASLATVATLLLLPRNQTVVPSPVVGHAYFLSSGQFNADNPQGINDELQMVLSGIPTPPPGKSYYAWLLADQTVSESLPLLLGPLHVNHGNVRFLYTGDQQHTNLLGRASRFLITVDDAGHPTNNPLIETSAWQYYAVIPLIPNPTDTLHFSLLDHLRHLLYESPELSIRGLHGGLAFWFVRNTAILSALANSSRDAWRNKDTATIHTQVIRLLDYLDGPSFARTDLPTGTPLLADARTSQVALLGPAPHNPDAPGYAYQGEVPPGYIYLLSEHMAGAIQAPQTTPEQHTLAVQINRELDGVKSLFDQMEHDAKHLLSMNTAQLLQPSALTLLNDLATQAQDAYTGQIDPTTGQSNGGALRIYGDLQQLASFDVRPFVKSA